MEITDAQFDRYRTYIRQMYGINMGPQKKEMLQFRLIRLLEYYHLSSFDAYFDLLTHSRERSVHDRFASEVTINKTDFFREEKHFGYLQENIQAILLRNSRTRTRQELRAWSAGCSTGEEPYTLAMVLKECLPAGMQVRILATDLSTKVLATAQQGWYSDGEGETIPPPMLNRYFIRSEGGYQIIPAIREMVTFRQLNLMQPFHFQQTFDLVFCRNVMIYFDTATQQQLVDKFYNVLAPGGLLFIGHSESFLNKAHRFHYVQPALYRK